MVKIFKELQVIRTPDREKIIYWKIAKSFKWLNTYIFRIGVAKESLGDFETVGDTDHCLFFDTEKRLYGENSDLWYRVQIVDTTDDSVVVSSIPVQMQGALSGKAFKLAKRMLQQFYLKLRKGGAQHGFFLKRKMWGDPCPSCVDFDVESVVNGHCPICYGTGIVGGYHTGLPLWIQTSVAQHDRSRSVIGTADTVQLQGECAAYPFINPYDVWLDGRTGERFLVTAVKNVLELERKPVTLVLGLTRIAETSSIMDVPIKATPEEPVVVENISSMLKEALVDYMPDTRDTVLSTETNPVEDWRQATIGGDY